MAFLFRGKAERQAKEEAEFLAPQLIDQVNESVDLINSTKNPETFFFRYDFLVKTLKKLVAMEKYVVLTAEKPSVALERVMLDRHHMIDALLERCFEDTLSKAIKLKTPIGRERRVESFALSLKPYMNQMEKVNIEKVNQLILLLEDELELL